jgi:hypothetical protein
VKSVSSICKGVMATALVLATTAMWADGKGSLGLQHPTQVAGKTLESGNYSVRWDGKDDQVELKIFKGKNMVASVPARVVQLGSAAPFDSAVVNNDGNGNMSLAQIRFGGKKYALQVGSESGGSGSGSSGASR